MFKTHMAVSGLFSPSGLEGKRIGKLEKFKRTCLGLVARKLYHKEKIKYSRISERFPARTIVKLVEKMYTKRNKSMLVRA